MNSGSAGSRKELGEGPGGRRREQRGRGRQGKGTGVEVDALVDSDDGDGWQKKNIKGAAGYGRCYKQWVPAW